MTPRTTLDSSPIDYTKKSADRQIPFMFRPDGHRYSTIYLNGKETVSETINIVKSAFKIDPTKEALLVTRGQQLFDDLGTYDQLKRTGPNPWLISQISEVKNFDINICVRPS
ncbi:hypothetical protein [Hydrogenophaga sp.]|uniref:hypothetical protein n=1 Tax=Hydrogenophaga sp. TaxID=1904254 RepID=UPI0027220A73|nr:hypothetical protein [Hydrogenophaga sp.]MDO9434244.1 hypothetical protein [Hydrogenophaga sp.]